MHEYEWTLKSKTLTPNNLSKRNEISNEMLMEKLNKT